MLPAAEKAARIVKLVQRLQCVDDRYRVFTVRKDDARHLYALDEETLDRSMDAGLSQRRHDGEVFFDRLDLSNLSLYLGRSSVQRMAMRTWAATLKSADRGEWQCASVAIQGEPSQRWARPGDEVGVLDPEQGRVFDRFGANVIFHRLKITAGGGWPPFPRVITELFSEILRLDFFLVPEGHRWDLDFLVRTGIAECGGAAKLLVKEARRRGIPARHCFGLLLARPYSTGHYWAEINIDGRWTPADPLLIKLMVSLCSLPAEQWPIHRSPGSIFFRLVVVEGYDARDGSPIFPGSDGWSEVVNPLAVSDGREVAVSLPTEFVGA